MFQILRNAWKITDLRKKILFTVFILLIFRVGSAITVPFVDTAALASGMQSNSNDFMGYLSMMSGGGFSNASLFALSITPYINASIIIQLLTVAIPYLENLSKEGEAGRKKLGQFTRYGTVILGLMLGIAYYFMVKNQYHALTDAAMNGTPFARWFSAIVIILCFTAGSALMMWLGEQINEKGIGNGISMLLFAGILSRIPVGAAFLWRNFWDAGLKQVIAGQAGGIQGIWNAVIVLLILVLFLAMIGFIVFMSDAERRIPVQYAKKVVGRKMYGGQSTHMPIKVNMSGVMPIILAVSILSLPSILVTFFGEPKKAFWQAVVGAFAQDSWFYIVLYALMIVGFAFFYVTIQYNPVEMANNLRKNGGAIPGQRPGKPTADFIKRVLNKVTFIGALFLGVVALFPSVFGKITNIYGLTIGGTSIMIVVGVALETVQQIESQMMMRHYKGFLD